MAMTDAEKKAYAKEYYEKYRKKGLKKGRKKGKKKATTSSLVGTSTSGLNSDGKIEAALIKEKIKTEMNAALAKAKTPEERENIRREFSKKANAEIQKLKSDPKFAQAKAAKAAKSSSGTKSSGSKGSKSAGATKAATTKTSTSTASTKTKQESLNKINDQITQLSEKLSSLSSEQRLQVREQVTSILDTLRKRLTKVRGK